MGKKSKHTKLTSAAHIKRHTEGTSNELSFSVLDAAKNAADGAVGKDAKAPRFGGISIFTIPGKKKALPTPQKDNVLPITSTDALPQLGAPSSPVPIAPEPKRTPYVAPVDEIARRKSRRRKRNAVAILLVLAVIIGLGGAGASFLYKEYQSHTERVSMLDTALADLTAADKAVLTMHKLVTADVDETTAAQVAELDPQLAEAMVLLDTAEQEALSAQDGMRDSVDLEVANRALAAIGARRDLISAGSSLLSERVAAYQAAAEITAGWELVLAADQLARDAAALVTETTAENVTASRTKSIEARDQFAAALSRYQDAAYLYPAAALQPVIDYIAKRIESAEYAIASDDAILAENKEEAAAQNDAYNAAEAEAAALAKQLPTVPTKPIEDAYQTETAESRETYSDARATAETADGFIRDYLGTSGK